MPRASRFDLPPLDYGGESLGDRLARFRHRRGLSQAQVANRIGIIQALVSDYERDCLRLSADMAVRFAQALHVSLDELLLPCGESRPLKNHQPVPVVVHPMARLAVAELNAGPEGLTRMERMIFGYLERGFTNPEIAQETGRRQSTIKAHVASIMDKLGVSSRRELARDRPQTQTPKLIRQRA